MTLLHKITLEGKPLSTNLIYKVNCSKGFPTLYMSADGKALKEDYQWQTKSQWHDKPLARELKIRVKLYFNDKRVRDVDNYNKILYDALTGIVWEDDRQVIEVTTSKYYNKLRPRIEVFIKP